MKKHNILFLILGIALSCNAIVAMNQQIEISNIVNQEENETHDNKRKREDETPIKETEQKIEKKRKIEEKKDTLSDVPADVIFSILEFTTGDTKNILLLNKEIYNQIKNLKLVDHKDIIISGLISKLKFNETYKEISYKHVETMLNTIEKYKRSNVLTFLLSQNIYKKLIEIPANSPVNTRFKSIFKDFTTKKIDNFDDNMLLKNNNFMQQFIDWSGFPIYFAGDNTWKIFFGNIYALFIKNNMKLTQQCLLEFMIKNKNELSPLVIKMLDSTIKEDSSSLFIMLLNNIKTTKPFTMPPVMAITLDFIKKHTQKIENIVNDTIQKIINHEQFTKSQKLEYINCILDYTENTFDSIQDWTGKKPTVDDEIKKQEEKNNRSCLVQ